MFIILPTALSYRTRRPPIVTYSLMGVNAMVYLVSLVLFFRQGFEADSWVYAHFWLIPAHAVWYTYLTSMFVHAGFFHLFGNMIYAFLFCACVEDLIGRGRFLGLYLLGGLVAEFVQIAMTPDHFASELPTGGASGAISACLGAYLILLANTEIEFCYFGLLIFRFFSGLFSLPAWLFLCLWFLKDIFLAAVSFHTGKGQGGVAFGAHVGGFAAGLGLAALDKAFKRKSPESIGRPMRVLRPVHASPTQRSVHAGAKKGNYYQLNAVSREVQEPDIEMARILLIARRPDTQVVAALVYRGIEESAASDLVELLKAGKV